jgi:uncharacterized protein (DUF305 family)
MYTSTESPTETTTESPTENMTETTTDSESESESEEPTHSTTCEDESTTCPAGTVFTGSDCGDGFEAHMGCGGARCPSAVKLWDETNMAMHAGMAIKFSGDVMLDFVRGMVPHHQGALDMCDVLINDLTCAEWANLQDLDGLIHFCAHVRLEQEREIAGMTRWLEAKGEPLETECPVYEATSVDQSNDGEGHSMHSMSMGCGDTEAASSKAFMEANHLMHGGMGVELSCDHSVDFVRMMIPHHAGAVKMCEILNEHGESDEYLDELCVNVTRLQRAEVTWMSKWLDARGHATVAPCACAEGDPAPEPELPCEDVLPISSYCHWSGEARGDPAYCTCEGLTENSEMQCGMTVSVTGYGDLDVDEECPRLCGKCPAERPPLFYEACPDDTMGHHAGHYGGDDAMGPHTGHGSHNDHDDHDGAPKDYQDAHIDGHEDHHGHHGHDDHEDVDSPTSGSVEVGFAALLAATVAVRM